MTIEQRQTLMSNNADMFAHWALRAPYYNIEYLDNPIGVASTFDQLAYEIGANTLKRIKTDERSPS